MKELPVLFKGKNVGYAIVPDIVPNQEFLLSNVEVHINDQEVLEKITSAFRAYSFGFIPLKDGRLNPTSVFIMTKEEPKIEE